MPIFYTNTGSLGTLQVSGSTVISASIPNLVRIVGSGSSILSVSGSTGTIFEASDINTGGSKILSFSSASTEVFSIEKNKRIEFSGSLVVTGSATINNLTGSLFGSASYALTASFALNAGAGTVGGSGNTNRVAKFTAGTTIGDSRILDDGTSVQITGSTSFLVSVAAASTPSTTLTLNNNQDAGHRILFSNSATSTLAAIEGEISSSGAGTNDGVLKFWTATDGSMTEKMRITKEGNVGIGNTSPVYKLDVAGNFQTTGDAVFNGTNTLINSTNISVGDNSTDIVGIAGNSMYFNGTGRVGINYTSPATQLDVLSDDGVAAGEHPTIARFARNNSAGAIYLGYVANGSALTATQIRTSNGLPISIGTSTVSQSLTIVDSGNVGIGTTTPSQRLEVAGNEASTAKINNVGTVYGAGAFLNAFTTAGGNDLGFAGFIASQLNQVNRFYAGVHSPSGENQSFIGTPDANPLAFWTNATEKMRITSAGDVGIGTTGPVTKLDVRSGVITAGSDSSTNGIEIIRGYYTAGALTVIGSERSNGGPVIGYAVKPSTSAADAFLSSTSINVPRGAYTIAGADHKWYSGGAQTVAENSAVTMGRAMTLTSTGFLGVGTEAPTARLDVNGTISLSGGFFARLAGNYIQLYTSGSTNIGLYLGGSGDAANYYDNTNHYFRDIGGSSTYMHITNAANVGINKTNPTAKLDVNGDSFITGSLSVTSTQNVATFRVRNPSLGEANILFVTSSGRVAVNSSAPTARFQVGGIVSGDYIFRAVTNTGTTLLAVTGSRVGVLTENPEESFHVSTTSKFTQNVSVTGSLVVSGSNGAGIFSQGATLADYVTGISSTGSYMVWRAPFPCTVVALYGYREGGGNAQVNAFRTGSGGRALHAASNLTLTAAASWTATSVQNTAYSIGDALAVMISGSGGNNQIAVQVDFIRRF